MARRWARCSVSQAIAHGAELADRPVELRRLGREHRSVDARLAVRREHSGDLIEREAGLAPEHDQREPIEHGGIEEPAQAAPANRGDQALLLIEPQRRGRDTRPAHHLRNIKIGHALDLKPT